MSYAKPTQLWNVWLSKSSNQNHAMHFFRDKPCRRQWVLVFLVFVVLLEKMDSNEDLRTLGKAKRGRSKKKEIVTMFVEFAR